MPRYTKRQFAIKEDVSDAVLDTWIYRHGLPVVQIGRRVYIEYADFILWLENHKKVFSQKEPIRPTEVAMPAQLRKRSSVADKICRIN